MVANRDRPMPLSFIHQSSQTRSRNRHCAVDFLSIQRPHLRTHKEESRMSATGSKARGGMRSTSGQAAGRSQRLSSRAPAPKRSVERFTANGA